MLISVTASEVTIKGANRRRFQDTLVSNILSRFPKKTFRVEYGAGRIFFRAASFEQARAVDPLSKTFGIDYFSFPAECPPDIREIEKTVMDNAAALAGKKIRVETKRSDKRFPMTSQKVNEVIGASLVGSGCKVDLENPEKTVYIEITDDRALVSFERFKGQAGLPAGSSGKMLSLLSGGIDSPVSSWLMMKRGVRVDFLHVHQLPRNEDVKNSKIMRLCRKMMEYSPERRRLFLVPYTEFYKNSMRIEPRSELVLFRRFLMHLSNAISKEHGYPGVITGDSLGQVASQTVQNLFTTDEAAEIPVYRPLVGLNKQEIVDLAVRIGTFNDSIGEYKDCCSLVAHKSPSTRVPLGLAKSIEDSIGVASIVEKSMEQMEIVEV